MYCNFVYISSKLLSLSLSHHKYIKIHLSYVTFPTPCSKNTTENFTNKWSNVCNVLPSRVTIILDSRTWKLHMDCVKLWKMNNIIGSNLISLLFPPIIIISKNYSSNLSQSGAILEHSPKTEWVKTDEQILEYIHH